MDTSCQVVHSLPGRVRLRAAALKSRPDLGVAVEAALSHQQGVSSVRVNGDCGSVTLYYQDCFWTGMTLASHLERLLEELLPPAVQPIRPPVRPTLLECTIVSAAPGRIRLRMPSVKSGAAVAALVEAFLRSKPGVRGVRTNRECASVIVEFADDRWTPDALRQLLATLTLEDLEASLEGRAENSAEGPAAMAWVPMVASSTALFLGMASRSAAPVLIPLLSLGVLPIFQRALESLMGERKLNVDVLDASAASVLAFQGQWFTCVFMVWLVNLADYIRDKTTARARRAIREVMDYGDRPAWVLRDGRKYQVAVAEIQAGETVVVYCGGMIPVDGRTIDGRATVDEHVLTGESHPVEKGVGDAIFAGTVVKDGKLYLRVEKTGEHTRAARIVQMVEASAPQDTRIQNYAEKWADELVPYSFTGAGIAGLAGGAGRAASLLIIDYGTGIRVAAPVSVLSSLARGARCGILIKGGRSLERLAGIDALVFDKTGTLTTGTPDVVAVCPASSRLSRQRLLSLAAAAERRLAHPVSQALVRAAEGEGLEIPERTASKYTIGLGVEAVVDGTRVLVGNQRFMRAHQVRLSRTVLRTVREMEERGASPLFVTVEDQLAGTMALADRLRPEAVEVVAHLRQDGLRELVLLTGDRKAVAKETAQLLGIPRFVAEVFPEDKVEVIRQLKAEGYQVGVVGDGINDCPALAEADVGVAVGWGADAARESAHVVLLQGNLWQIPLAMEIARESMERIKEGWAITWIPNTVALGFAFLGIVGPVAATVISNGSCLVATMNSLRPLLNSSNGHFPPGVNRQITEATTRLTANSVTAKTTAWSIERATCEAPFVGPVRAKGAPTAGRPVRR